MDIQFPFVKFQAPGGHGWTFTSVHAWVYAALHAAVDNMAVVSLLEGFSKQPNIILDGFVDLGCLGVSTCNTSKAVIQTVSAPIQVRETRHILNS